MYSHQSVIGRGAAVEMTLCVSSLQAERWDSRKCIIPLLHTLMYAIIQVQYSCHIVAL